MFRNRPLPRSSRLAEIFLLVLMLWPAPVPIRHSHSDSASQSSGHQLTQHLQVHHGGLSNCQELPDDWHWHWVFPGDDYVGLGNEPIVAASEYMLPAESAELPEVDRACLIDRLASDRTTSLVKVPENRRYSFQSVALLQSRQSLPELLGIMRL